MCSSFEILNLCELGKVVLSALPFKVEVLSNKVTAPVAAFCAVLPEVLEEIVKYEPEMKIGYGAIFFTFYNPAFTFDILWNSDRYSKVRKIEARLGVVNERESELGLYLLDQLRSLGLPNTIYTSLRNLVKKAGDRYPILFYLVTLCWNEKSGWSIVTKYSGLAPSTWKNLMNYELLDVLRGILRRRDLTIEEAPNYLYRTLLYPLKKWLKPEKLLLVPPISHLLKLAERIAQAVPVEYFDFEIDVLR